MEEDIFAALFLSISCLDYWLTELIRQLKKIPSKIKSERSTTEGSIKREKYHYVSSSRVVSLRYKLDI